MIKQAVFGVAVAATLAASSAAAEPSLPSTFTTPTIASPEAADSSVRSGGAGPAVVLIHGFGDTGEMWGPLAAELAATYTVIVPDLRGMGRSSKPSGGHAGELLR